MEPVPVRMLNEVAYCERLFALEWIGDEWADNPDTVRGRTVHRIVDEPGRTGLAPPEDPDAPKVARSVKLSDDALGLLAVIDLVEVDGGGEVTPIDYKKGKAPDVPEGAWEPERPAVRDLVDGAFQRARLLLLQNRDLLQEGARRLLEKETLSDGDLTALLSQVRAEAARAA